MRFLTSKETREFWRFWTEPTSGHSAALFRISYGILVTWTAVGLLFNYQRYYSDQGMFPWQYAKDFPEQAISLISLAPQSETLLFAITLGFLLASLSMTVGFQARFSALLICAIQITLQHRNPYIVNGGDRLFSIMAGLGALMPLSKQWSVDAWRFARKRDSDAEPLFLARATVWSQRLVALQMAYIYLYAFGAKLMAPIWQDGSALFAVLSSTRLAEWPIEIHQPILIAALTWGTMLFELAFPVLVWFRKYRAYVLWMGIVFHMGIEITMKIPMFSPLMVLCYSAFLTDDETRRCVACLLRPLRRTT